MQAPCAACRTKPGTKVCSRCYVARFCGAECMRGHWPIHKLTCRAPAGDVLKKRALLAVCTVDLRRALPQVRTCGRRAGTSGGLTMNTQRTKLPRAEGFDFVWVTCSLAQDAKTLVTGLNMASVGISSHLTAAELAANACSVVSAVMQGGVRPEQFFTMPRASREAGGGADGIAIPQGLPGAAKACFEDLVRMLGEGEGSVLDRVQRMAKAVGRREGTHWAGDQDDGADQSKLGAEEAERYDSGYFENIQKTVPYDADALPVGLQLSTLHFSQGTFFKQVDCRTRLDGWGLDSAISLAPRLVVTDIAAFVKDGHERIDLKGVSKKGVVYKDASEKPQTSS